MSTFNHIDQEIQSESRFADFLFIYIYGSDIVKNYFGTGSLAYIA